VRRPTPTGGFAAAPSSTWASRSDPGGTTIGRTLVTLLLLCVVSPFPASAAVHSPRVVRALTASAALASASRQEAARAYETRRIDRADAKRRYWLRVMDRPLPPPVAGLARLELAELRRAADWRSSRADAVARLAHHPPHLAAWRCIQHYESGGGYAGWRTNTGNGYYGGLQFDVGFQLTYGRRLFRTKGTAEHWTPLEQMWTAERAHASGRGFTPWPNTARACGLL
jgi:hypothetical protein